MAAASGVNPNRNAQRKVPESRSSAERSAQYVAQQREQCCFAHSSPEPVEVVAYAWCGTMCVRNPACPQKRRVKRKRFVRVVWCQRQAGAMRGGKRCAGVNWRCRACAYCVGEILPWRVTSRTAARKVACRPLSGGSVCARQCYAMCQYASVAAVRASTGIAEKPPKCRQAGRQTLNPRIACGTRP